MVYRRHHHHHHLFLKTQPVIVKLYYTKSSKTKVVF